MRKIELRNIKRLTANVGDHSSNEIDQILSLCIVKEADKRASSLKSIYLMVVHISYLHYGAFIER